MLEPSPSTTRLPAPSSRRRLDPYFLAGIAVPFLIAVSLLGSKALARRSENRALSAAVLSVAPRLAELGVGQTLGNAHAPIRILELTDYECPGCATVHSWLWPLIQEQVRSGAANVQTFTIPLLGQAAGREAALHATCVAEQDGDAFWAFHHEVLLSRDTWAGREKPAPRFEQLAAALDLDIPGLRACVALGAAKRAALEQGADLALRGGVDVVPVLLVNDRLIVGTDEENYRDAFSRAIRLAGKNRGR